MVVIMSDPLMHFICDHYQHTTHVHNNIFSVHVFVWQVSILYFISYYNI